MSSNITKAELIDLIGHRATDELLRAWGGTYYSFPKKLPEFHPLISIVGRYNAGVLVVHLGGMASDLPVLDDREIDKRNELIFTRLSVEAATQNQVAAEFGITVRQVRAIFQKMQETNAA